MTFPQIASRSSSPTTHMEEGWELVNDWEIVENPSSESDKTVRVKAQSFPDSALPPCNSPLATRRVFNPWSASLEQFEHCHTSDIDPAAVEALPLEPKKALQVQTISDFFIRLMRDYYPLVSPGNQSTESLVFQAHIQTQFQELFPPIVPSLFFKNPSALVARDKCIMINCLKSISLFLQNYNTSIQYLKDNITDFDTLPESDKEELILANLRKFSQNRALNVLNDFSNDGKLTAFLCAEIQKLIASYLSYQDGSDETTSPRMKAFVAFGAAMVATPIVLEHIITPYFFCIVIDRLFTATINLTDDFSLKPQKSASVDKKFNEEVEQLINKVIREIFVLGRASGVASYLEDMLKSGTGKMGILIQNAINDVMGDDSFMKPVLMLDSFLYDKETPTLLDTIKITPEEKKLFQEKLKEDIKTKLYPFIIEKMPPIGGWLINQASSIKEFCETISSELFTVSQSPRLIKILFAYMIVGVQERLANQRGSCDV